MAAREMIAIVGILLPFPTYALSVPDAVAWILSQQNQDGGWGDQGKGVEYQVYITSGVLMGLSDFIISGSKNISEDVARIENSIEKGEGWLKMHKPTDTLGLSAYMRALEVDSLSADLVNHQNQDGGWGRGTGFKSTPWYTAKALLGLSPNSHRKELEAGAEYLIATQGDDGSWENTATATSAAILALTRVYSMKPKPSYIASARKGEGWLLAKQGGDGGWFDASSTAGAISALKAMYSYFRTAPERSSMDRGTAFLLSIQRKDGSWGASPSSRIFDDTHTSAEVISSFLGGLPYEALEPKLRVYTNVSSAHVMEGDGVKMAVTASNEGFLEVKDAEITIGIPVALGGRRVNWTMDSLEIGKNVTKYFNISIPSGSVGEHVVGVEVAFTQANELDRRYRSKGEGAVIRVHGTPLELRLAPSQVANGSRWNFTAILVNKGDVTIVVENLSVHIEADWEEALVFENYGTTIEPSGEVSVRVFEASSPRAPGGYVVPIRVFVRHPSLGGRWFSFDKDVAVSQLESHSTVPMVPSRVYNLISMAILLSASALVLNLLLGLDVVE
ncbi:MAG: prenyltransferase/squalene oxidase repeat-containing protein [Candidatus Hydrothermarchaeaceae archaeon]